MWTLVTPATVRTVWFAIGKNSSSLDLQRTRRQAQVLVAPQATVISAQEAQNDGSTGYPE
jgi:hypothetical protein